jgi:hypothetical protein
LAPFRASLWSEKRDGYLHGTVQPRRTRDAGLGVVGTLGGPSPAARRLLVAVAKSAEAKHNLPRTQMFRLKPGTKLIREWQGKTHSVLVLEDGFQWRGRRWRSLSAVAREISGTSWSGPRFFGLPRQADEQNQICTRQAADENSRV